MNNITNTKQVIDVREYVPEIVSDGIRTYAKVLVHVMTKMVE